MGETPEIPETLSEEGKEFLQQVFVHDPTGNYYIYFQIGYASRGS